MTYVFNPASGEITNIASATASVTNSRRDSYSLDETQKKHYAKAVKYAKTKNKFWTERIPMDVPLNIPTLSDNRFTHVEKATANLKNGFEPALFQMPLVVAIPGKFVKDACLKDPTFKDRWDVRPEGFWNINQGSEDSEFYLQVCDGRHRQLIKAAELGHPEFNNFSELQGSWECQVVVAQTVKSVDDVEEAFKQAHRLYLDINSKKIRKPSASDNLGAEIRSGDQEANQNIVRMENTGFWVEGGKNGYGDLTGVKTKYAIFRRDALKNPMINDVLLAQSSKWIKLDNGFNSKIEYSPTLAAALALVQVVVPKLVGGNGVQSVFESWLANKLSDNSSADLVSYWKELGGNQDNRYAESVALGMMTDFKSTRLKKAMKQGEEHKSAYHAVVLETIKEKLFPKIIHNIAPDQDVELETEIAI